MSYDLYFWRQLPALTQNPESVLRLLEDNASPRGIAPLSLPAIKAAFLARFPNISVGDAALDWEGCGSYFQVGFTFIDSHSVSCIAVHCGYNLLQSAETMNSIIDAVNSLGCALYDPQTAERYEQPEPRDDRSGA